MKLTGNFSEDIVIGLCEAIVDDAIENGELPHGARQLAIDELMKYSPRSTEIDVEDDMVSEIFVDVVG